MKQVHGETINPGFIQSLFEYHGIDIHNLCPKQGGNVALKLPAAQQQASYPTLPTAVQSYIPSTYGAPYPTHYPAAPYGWSSFLPSYHPGYMSNQAPIKPSAIESPVTPPSPPVPAEKANIRTTRKKRR
jgi:hypothetical protein